MRVLVVTNDLPPRVGGIQYYVDQLCRGLGRAGDQVTVYPDRSVVIRVDSVRIAPEREWFARLELRKPKVLRQFDIFS